MTRVLVALLGWVVMPGAELSDTPQEPVVRAARPLVPLEGAGPLMSAYALPVVSVPEVPVFNDAPALADGDAKPLTCPLELRAVVIAEDAADSFAMAAVAGESRLLRVGESLSLGAGRGTPTWAVVGLAENAVTLRVGESRVTCGLSN